MRAQSFVKDKPRSMGAVGLMRRVKSGEFIYSSALRKGRFEVGGYLLNHPNKKILTKTVNEHNSII